MDGNSPRTPNFFLVGAPKCGTTSMFAYLRRHPDVFLSEVKEPHFFATDLETPGEKIRDPEAYRALFAAVNGQKIVGECSVFYLYSRRAAAEIHRFAPDARILIMLRNPLDMMHSLHNQLVLRCEDDIEDFAAALDAEDERKAGRLLPPRGHSSPEILFYRDIGRYAEQVQRYFDLFGRERVQVILFDDFQSATRAAYESTCDFLDIEPEADLELGVHNARSAPRSARFSQFLVQPARPLRLLVRALTSQSLRRKTAIALYRWNLKRAPQSSLPPALVKRVQHDLRPDIERLGTLLGRDLSHWHQNGSESRP